LRELIDPGRVAMLMRLLPLPRLDRRAVRPPRPCPAHPRRADDDDSVPAAPRPHRRTAAHRRRRRHHYRPPRHAARCRRDGGSGAVWALRAGAVASSPRHRPHLQRRGDAAEGRRRGNRGQPPPLPRSETDRLKNAGCAAVPPINQWGQLPLPIRPLSPHSTSRLARPADTGPAHHKAVRVNQFVAALNVDQPAPEPAPVPPV